MNKKDLSERDICCKFIGPAVKRAGWDGMMQIREEVAFTKGTIAKSPQYRNNMFSRGNPRIVAVVEDGNTGRTAHRLCP
jgi:type I restriction enzyme R subunit